MTAPRRVAREFWISMPQNINGNEQWDESHASVVRRFERIKEKDMEWMEFIHVREVNPDMDKAVEGMVEALNYYRNPDIYTGLTQRTDKALHTTIAKQALAAYNSALGKEK